MLVRPKRTIIIGTKPISHKLSRDSVGKHLLLNLTSYFGLEIERYIAAGSYRSINDSKKQYTQLLYVFMGSVIFSFIIMTVAYVINTAVHRFVTSTYMMYVKFTLFFTRIDVNLIQSFGSTVSHSQPPILRAFQRESCVEF